MSNRVKVLMKTSALDVVNEKDLEWDYVDEDMDEIEVTVPDMSSPHTERSKDELLCEYYGLPWDQVNRVIR